MLENFQTAAEAVGATVKRFTEMDHLFDYVRNLAGNSPISISKLPDEVLDDLKTIPTTSLVKGDETDICLSFARAGIASTGSLLLELDKPDARANTALPQIHAVILKSSTIVPDIYALEPQLAELLGSGRNCYFSLTTGPSRTADIERVLTIGVHGPKELHVLLLLEGE